MACVLFCLAAFFMSVISFCSSRCRPSISLWRSGEHRRVRKDPWVKLTMLVLSVKVHKLSVELSVECGRSHLACPCLSPSARSLLVLHGTPSQHVKLIKRSDTGEHRAWSRFRKLQIYETAVFSTFRVDFLLKELHISDASGAQLCARRQSDSSVQCYRLED